MTPAFFRYVQALLLLAALALLSGCGSLAAKVTNFNAWPADAAGARFSFRPPTEGATGLEQATYESYVRAELERQGLRAAEPGQRARLQVEVIATEAERTRTWLEPIYQHAPVYVAPYRDARGVVYPGYWAPDPFGPRWIGDRQVARTVQLNRLKVLIYDTAGGSPRPVFDATAVYEGDTDDELAQRVPFLVRAVFDDFPGRSGRVSTVRFDPRTGEVVRR